MTLETLSIQIGVDDVLRAQGADPETIRRRRPGIVKLAEEVVELGRELLRPAVWLKTVAVRSFLHGRIDLEDGHSLRGALVAEQLAGSSAVAFAIGTLGDALEAQITARMKQDPSLGFFLDAYGSAGAEALANQLEAHFRAEADAQNLPTSLPLSPGLIGWPIEQGQPQIFAVLQPDAAAIRLTPSGQMVPRKSFSFVMGLGCPQGVGSPCEFCGVRDTCPNRKKNP